MAQPSLIRDINQVRALNLLRGSGPSSRAEIARSLNLTRSTVTHLVNSLMQQGLVTENGKPTIQRVAGRPGVDIRLNPNGAYFVGADLGIETLSVIIIDLTGQIVFRDHTPFQRNDAPQHVINRLATLVLTSLTKAGIIYKRTHSIGVTLPATVESGRLINAPLLAWHDVEVAGALSDLLPAEVIVENDANAAALAQLYFARDPAVRNLVYLSLGAGVGAGIIIDGKIYRGSFGAAGEVGYMRLAAQGPQDSKGNEATLEAFIGIPGLFKLYHEHGGTHETVSAFFLEYDAGLRPAAEAVHEWAQWLSRALISLFNVLNPQHIVLGGPLSPILPSIVEELREALRKEQIPGSAAVVVDISPFGTEDNVMGAVTLGYHSLFSVSSFFT